MAATDAAGVTACATVAQAVQGAERIHLSLSNDASVDAVLEPLAGVLPAGAWAVDHTTTAVRPTAERVARWDAWMHQGDLELREPNCTLRRPMRRLFATAQIHGRDGSRLIARLPP